MKMMTKIKDIWEDFRYMNEGSYPKYFINKCIWGIWFVLFVASLVIAVTLGILLKIEDKKKGYGLELPNVKK